MKPIEKAELAEIAELIEHLAKSAQVVEGAWHDSRSRPSVKILNLFTISS